MKFLARFLGIRTPKRGDDRTNPALFEAEQINESHITAADRNTARSVASAQAQALQIARKRQKLEPLIVRYEIVDLAESDDRE